MVIKILKLPLMFAYERMETEITTSKTTGAVQPTSPPSVKIDVLKTDSLVYYVGRFSGVFDHKLQ
jgi:hypothetical protein